MKIFLLIASSGIINNMNYAEYNRLNKNLYNDILNVNTASNNISYITLAQVSSGFQKLIIDNFQTIGDQQKLENHDVSIAFFNIFSSLARCYPCRLFHEKMKLLFNKIHQNLQQHIFRVMWNVIFTTLHNEIPNIFSFTINNFNNKYKLPALSSYSVNIYNYVANLISNVNHDKIISNIDCILLNLNQYIIDIVYSQTNIMLDSVVYKTKEYIRNKNIDQNNFTSIIDISIENLNQDIIDAIHLIVSYFKNNEEILIDIKNHNIKELKSKIENIINIKFDTLTLEQKYLIRDLCIRIFHFALYSTALSNIFEFMLSTSKIIINNIDMQTETQNNILRDALEHGIEFASIPFGTLNYVLSEHEIKDISPFAEDNNSFDIIGQLEWKNDILFVKNATNMFVYTFNYISKNACVKGLIFLSKS